VYGEFPVYDDGTYTFLADYLPHVSGDGMEHRNSTIVASQNSLLQAARGLLGTVSHEFFHSWNVERIRPRSLEPFNFESTNMSGELWLAEGFTSYYGPLTMHRAGLTLFEDYAHSLAGAINAVTNAPGRRYRSPTEMSMLAPFVDAATAIDPTSFPHTFISYYTWGQALGLALDLTLRQRFPGVTSDDFMREMWTTHGKTERPYTTTDARDALGRVSGDTAFAGEFWRRYVLGREIPDYQVLLAPAGLLVRQRDREAAWIGDLGLDGPEGATVGSRVLVGTPAYLAGLETGDRILSLDGRAITSPGDVGAILAARHIGDQIEIVFESRGQRVEGRVDLTSDPRLEVVTFEEAGREVTASIRAFRSDWLGSKVK
jgi:predicted metalloprotease with PDZ domain